MQPLNFKDVNQKFWQFLLLFSIAVLVLLIALYFNMRLPILENKVLREQLNESGLLEQNQENKNFQISLIEKSLQRYDRQSKLYSQDSIYENIKKLSAMHTKNDSSMVNSICNSFKKQLSDAEEKANKDDSLIFLKTEVRSQTEVNTNILNMAKNCLTVSEYNDLLQSIKTKSK